MSRRALLSLFLCSSFVLATAAPASGALTVSWTAKAAKSFNGVAADASGNSYAVGWTMMSGDYAAILIKYSPSGAKLWSRTWLPPAAGFTTADAVAVGPDGSVYWGGNVSTPGCEGAGWWVRRMTPNGGLVWHRDQAGWEACTSSTMLSDLDVGDNLVALALTDRGCCADPFQDGWVRAIRTNGAFAWNRDFEPPTGTPTSYYDRATGVAVSALDTVYVGGWAATQFIPDDMSHYTGIAEIQKVTPAGAIVWRKKVLRVPHVWTDTMVAVRGDRLMVTTQSRGGSIYWGTGTPPEAWLGRYTLDGTLVWWRTWGTEWNWAALPAQLSIDGALNTWVVGTRRDPGDHGYDLFVRQYAPGGGVLEARTIEGPTRWLLGTGVAARGIGALVTGTVGTDKWGDPDGGRLYRLV